MDVVTSTLEEFTSKVVIFSAVTAFFPFTLPDIAEDQVLQLQSNRILILGFPANQKQFFFFVLL